jgi:hypothetical protein
MVKLFNTNLTTLLDLHAPEHILKINRNKSNFVFSHYLQSLANLRDFHHTCWIRFKTKNHRENFKKARNKFNSVLRFEMRKHYEIKFNPKHPPKILFSRLRESGLIYERKLNEINDVFTLEEFNSYFSSEPGNKSNSELSSFDNIGGFAFRNVSDSEVLIALSQIKSNSTGIDGIPIKFIHILSPVISLFNFYNQYLYN